MAWHRAIEERMALRIKKMLPRKNGERPSGDRLFPRFFGAASYNNSKREEKNYLLFSRKELHTTLTLLMAIAAPAIMGLSMNPHSG